MSTRPFVQAVRERLHPSTYPGLLQTLGSPCDLLLVRSRGRLAHDVLGVVPLAPGADARALVESVRADVERRFGALCYQREIVLHLIVHGPSAAWRDAAGALCADRTGFRGVMIQSVYVVDPDSGASHKSVSRWGALRWTRRTARDAGEVESAAEVPGRPQPA